MCVNSLGSRERWKFESQELCNTLYTANTRALLMGVTNSFLKRVMNQLCELLNGPGLTLVSACLRVCLWVSGFVFIVHVNEVRLLPKYLVLTVGTTALLDATFYV